MRVMERLRVAHISDLHFGKVTLSPLQFFSKRWIGNLNLALARKRSLAPEKLDSLLTLLQGLRVDLVVVTGDLSTTSLKDEFLKAKEFLSRLENAGIKTVIIPGNHDHYTQRAWKQRRFYDFFPSHENRGLDLRTDGIAVIELNTTWTMVALDTALATALTSSRGLFSPDHEKKLFDALSAIPKSKNIMIINHFPLFQHERSSKILERAPALQETLKNFSNIRFYLHGHTHNHCIADLRANGLPIILDSGSTADQQRGSWNLIDLLPYSAELQAYHGKLGNWQPFRKVAWSFR